MLELVTSETDLRAIWPQVRIGLNVVLKRCHYNWFPEDVFASIRSGNSKLIIGRVDGEFAGFVVIEYKCALDGLEAHIWVLYNRAGHDILSESWGAVLETIKQPGLKRITASSNRHESAMTKFVSEFGFSPVHTLYSLELGNGQ